ncbi:SDR family oxidoreductase [Rhizobium binxianense]
MSTILITGATGFIGGAVAASLLARGDFVVSISRNDPHGTRTRDSVLDAADGIEVEVGPQALRRLTVVDARDADLANAVDQAILDGIDLVWHCAAEMSFWNMNLPQAFQTNVCGTADLYGKIAAYAPNCRRFYYVSTAYTTGMGGGDVSEELHVGNPCINAYQTTKWCAEHALSHLHHQCRVPVTVFRPTIVVGHSRTGWTRRNRFGLYGYVEAIQMAGDEGSDRVRLNIADQGRPDIIPIDNVIDDAVGLLSRADQGSDLEILHCSGGRNLTMQQVASIAGEVVGVNVNFGAPETQLDRQAHHVIKWTLPFANEDWAFHRSRMDAALGRAHERTTLSASQWRHLVAWYCKMSVEESTRVVA